MKLFTPLTSIILVLKSEKLSEQDIANSQLALLSLKLLGKLLSHSENKKNILLPMLEMVLEILNFLGEQPSANHHAVASCLLCVSQLSTSLEKDSIPKLPVFVPIILQYLASS